MSRIEQLIDEIEEYIEGCKTQPFSSTKIIVDKAQLEELLVELRHRTLDEIKKYQKILSNKEAIIVDARAQANRMIEDATEQTNEMINEHEIMQRAYIKANEIIDQATKQAQEIVDNAVDDANSIRIGAVNYTDDMLNSLQTIISHTMENTQAKFANFMTSMKSSYEIVSANRRELAPSEEEEGAAENSEAAAGEETVSE